MLFRAAASRADTHYYLVASAASQTAHYRYVDGRPFDYCASQVVRSRTPSRRKLQ